MTKSEVLMLFPTVSPSVIKKIEDEYEIVGKFCRVIIFDDGKIDLWLCNPKKMFNGLSKRKLDSLVKALEVPTKGSLNDQTKESISFTVVDGEAWLNLDLPDLILNNLKVLGIRKKRELSISQRQSLVKRLKKKAA